MNLLLLLLYFIYNYFLHSLFTFRLYFSLWDPKPAHKGNIYRHTPVQWCSPYRFSLYNAGFSIRAGSRQNSPAISCQLSTYYSLEITPPPQKPEFNVVFVLFKHSPRFAPQCCKCTLKGPDFKIFHPLASCAFGTRRCEFISFSAYSKAFATYLKPYWKPCNELLLHRVYRKNNWGYSIYRSLVYCKIFLKFMCIKSWSEDNIFIHHSGLSLRFQVAG